MLSLILTSLVLYIGINEFKQYRYKKKHKNQLNGLNSFISAANGDYWQMAKYEELKEKEERRKRRRH